MTRVKTLHNNPKHGLAENTPFMLRLRFKMDEAPTKSDCINLMKQYHFLYAAMEKRLSELETTDALKFFATPPWNERSKLLKKDIEEMSLSLEPEESAFVDNDDYQYPATQAILKVLRSADKELLFAFFAVRCLGDVFGGSKLKEYNERAFNPTKLTSHFYLSVNEKVREIVGHVNKAECDEALLESLGDQVFQYHLDLFTEMETNRRKIIPVKHEENTRTQNTSGPAPNTQYSYLGQPMRCSFFSFAVGATTVALALGTKLYLDATRGVDDNHLPQP